MTATQEQLLEAVTDEWERAIVIADRAGVDRRGAGQKLGALVKQGLVVSSRAHSGRDRRAGERVYLYRRGPGAPVAMRKPTVDDFAGFADGLMAAGDALALQLRNPGHRHDSPWTLQVLEKWGEAKDLVSWLP